MNSEYLKSPSLSVSYLLNKRYISSLVGKIWISFKASSNSSFVTYPLALESKTLKASKRLKSTLRASCFLISSISLSILICSLRDLTSYYSSFPFIGETSSAIDLFLEGVLY